MVKGRLANWAYKLRSYDFTIVYRKGSENHLADFLSRAVSKAEILLLEAPSNEWTTKEARYTAVLLEALRVVDNGKPRPSRPARTTFPMMPIKRAPRTQAHVAGSTLSAHPLATSTDGVGEGFAGALPCSLAEAKAGGGKLQKSRNLYHLWMPSRKRNRLRQK